MSTDDDFDKRFDDACKARAAECAEIDKRYPINPNDPPEVQEQMRIARQAAKLDA